MEDRTGWTLGRGQGLRQEDVPDVLGCPPALGAAESRDGISYRAGGYVRGGNWNNYHSGECILYACLLLFLFMLHCDLSSKTPWITRSPLMATPGACHRGEIQSNPGSGFHGKIDFSQPPWCASVAHAIMDLHAQSRDAEACLRIALRLPKRQRAGSSHNTRVALESVVRLSTARGDDSVKGNAPVARRVEQESQHRPGMRPRPPEGSPGVEGVPEPPCPFCKNRTLRMLPSKG